MYSSPMLKNLLASSSPGLVTTPTISNSKSSSRDAHRNTSPTPSPCATRNSRPTITAPPASRRSSALSSSPSTNSRCVIPKNSRGSNAMNEVV
jgi:uncharacterized protein (DUF3084 family)